MNRSKVAIDRRLLMVRRWQRSTRGVVHGKQNWLVRELKWRLAPWALPGLTSGPLGRLLTQMPKGVHCRVARRKLWLGLIAATVAVAVPTAPSVLAACFVVKPGNTLSYLAGRFHTTVSTLAALNHIANPNLIYVGEVIKLPVLTHFGSCTSVTYRVTRGQNLTAIARHFDTSVSALMNRNHIQDPDLIWVGQLLHVAPGSTYTQDCVRNQTQFKRQLSLREVGLLINRVATGAGVSPRLVGAVAWMESGWQEQVVSPTHAVGIMQVEPYVGIWVSRYLAKRPLNLHNAEDNILAGSLLLHFLLVEHHGNLNMALAAYYQGDYSIHKHGLYPQTKHYVADVVALMRRGK